MRSESTGNLPPQHLNRVRASLRQHARTRGIPRDRLERVIDAFPDIISRCGEKSRGRRDMKRLGEHLLQDSPTVIAISCPDYAHADGRYTFGEVSDGVPLLARKHIVFLRMIQNRLPGLHVRLALADQEADDPLICRCVNKTREQFLACIARSVREVQREVEPFGWQVQTMTSMIPGLRNQLDRLSAWIRNDQRYLPDIELDAKLRLRLYYQLGAAESPEDERERTVATAAQYVALARFARERRWIICNHTTQNLDWLLREHTALLHNPTDIY